MTVVYQCSVLTISRGIMTAVYQRSVLIISRGIMTAVCQRSLLIVYRGILTAVYQHSVLIISRCCMTAVCKRFVLIIFFFIFPFCFVNFHFFYRQHIHHITCTEQDKHITSVNDSYCYLCAQHITTFFLKSIVIVITTLFPINHYLFINI